MEALSVRKRLASDKCKQNQLGRLSHYTTDRGGYPQEIKLWIPAEVAGSESYTYIGRSQTDQSADNSS